MLASVAVSPSTVRIVSWASILLSRGTELSYLSAGPPGTTPAGDAGAGEHLSEAVWREWVHGHSGVTIQL